MKILLDANLSWRLGKLLQTDFGTCIHAEELGKSLPDIALWRYAKANNFVVLTRDEDFNHLHAFYGFPPKIIWLRIPNLSTNGICAFMTQNISVIQNFIKDSEVGLLELIWP